MRPIERAGSGTGKEPGIASPDRKLEAFVRDWNLWVRDVGNGQGDAAHHRRRRRTSATPPTTPAGSRPTGPVLDWSPDSKEIATFQQDQRDLGEMYLVSTQGRPSAS